jgi:ferric enterobactin receptor
MGQAAAAWAQTAPAPPSPPPPAAGASGQDEANGASPDDQEVIVVAPASERTSIDRTTYIVRDTAEARSSSTLDLLDRIPTIEVTPSGQLRLLGRGGVRILIDGNEVANPEVVLRNLQGSQVARIEVISNPSARFSAQGTAGIVNIVTRRSFASGLGGSLTANAGSFGSFDLKASPTWSRGRLSLSGSLGFARTASRSDFAIDRSAFDPGGGLATQSRESGDRRNEGQSLTGNLIAVFRPTPGQSINVTAIAVQGDVETSRRSEILSSADPGTLLAQTSSGTAEISTRDLSIDYRRDGDRPGETLTVSGKRSTSRVQVETVFATDSGTGDPSIFALRSEGSTRTTTASIDYLRPSGGQRSLALGGTIRHSRDFAFSEQTGQLPLGQDMFSAVSTIRGSYVEKAAYLTYQFPWLGGTVLAGLRVEDRRYDFPEGAPGAAPGGAHLFPSLHVERVLARGLTATLSYSRRITWPGIGELDPAVRFSDSTTANAGNPSLRPEITDSFEGKLKAQPAGQSIELTLFSRRTRDLRSSAAELTDDGVLILRPINLGAQTSRGLNLSLQGPLGSGFAYSLNGNLSDQSIDQNGVGGNFARANTRYGGSVQLEYRDGVEGRRGTDHIQLRLRYSGPFDLGLFRISSFFTSSASWSHAFTDRLSGVLAVSDPIGPPSIRTTYLSGDVVSRQTERAAGPRVTFSLTYSLNPPARR